MTEKITQPKMTSSNRSHGSVEFDVTRMLLTSNGKSQILHLTRSQQRDLAEDLREGAPRAAINAEAHRLSRINREAQKQAAYKPRAARAASTAVAASVEHSPARRAVHTQKASLTHLGAKAAWGATLFSFKTARRILRTRVGATAAVVGGIMLYANHTNHQELTYKDSDKAAVSAPAFTPETLQAENLQLNPIAAQMYKDRQPYTVLNFEEYLPQVKGWGSTFGEKISMGDIMRNMYIGGFRGNDLIIATAIAERESIGGYPAAIGDVGYKGDERVSVGLGQITCGADGIICEGFREPQRNMDPLYAAIDMKAVHDEAVSYWGEGSGVMKYDGGFHPWQKTGKDTAQEVFLPQAQATYKEFELMYGDLNAG